MTAIAVGCGGLIATDPIDLDSGIDVSDGSILPVIDASVTTDSTPACSRDKFSCSGSCVDLAADHANCGKCGKACAANEVCSLGSCELSCSADATLCGGDAGGDAGTPFCATTATDPLNCGGCGTVCPTGDNADTTCTASTCTIACKGGFGDCDMSAANGCEIATDADPLNCGACGQSCGDGTCSAGTCFIKPSHADATTMLPGAGDLPSTVTAIDTTNLTLNGGAIALPTGAAFVAVGEDAILSVGAWNVTADVTVTGTRRLIVVAAKAVTVGAHIFASADHTTAGPGGAAGAAGPGAGTSIDNSFVLQDPGGGGAGFLVAGGNGGTTTNTLMLAGGASYGPLVTDWNGGSGGGNGSASNLCATPGALGGAAGGAVQITSAVSVTVTAAGTIEANGGGGLGGCTLPGEGIGGGGGGSGGAVFLEAPTVSVAGGLFANGGGGGASSNNNVAAGGDGANGTANTTPAAGGLAAGVGATGGAGGTDVAPTAGGDAEDSGGGGGSAGRIILRTRTTAASVAGTVSPTPVTDTTL
jgi:hypothetical protein